jgi:hypothetical protein
MVVKHQVAQSRVERYGGKGNARRHGAGRDGLDHRNGKALAWNL